MPAKPGLSHPLNRQFRPERIVIGQEAGIRTRTVSFTGRDAANYTTILI